MRDLVPVAFIAAAAAIIAWLTFQPVDPVDVCGPAPAVVIVEPDRRLDTEPGIRGDLDGVRPTLPRPSGAVEQAWAECMRKAGE